MGFPASHGVPQPREGWQPCHGIGGSFAVESAAAFVWNRWQACYGISGNFRVERVAALPWNQWQDSPGIGGSFAVEYARSTHPMKLCVPLFTPPGCWVTGSRRRWGCSGGETRTSCTPVSASVIMEVSTAAAWPALRRTQGTNEHLRSHRVSATQSSQGYDHPAPATQGDTAITTRSLMTLFSRDGSRPAGRSISFPFYFGTRHASRDLTSVGVEQETRRNVRDTE